MNNNLDKPKQMQTKQRIFIICGIIMPIFFALLVIVASILRPGYSQIQTEISYLGIGSYSIIQNMNFIISGLLSIGFAIGIGTILPPNRAGKTTKWMVIIFGIGLILAGIFLILSILIFGEFPTNYVFYYLHTIASFIAFLTAIAAQLLIWQSLKNSNKAIWGSYPIYSLMSGLLSIIMLIVFLFNSSGHYQGLTERLVVAVIFIWIEVTGLKLYSLLNKTSKLVNFIK